MYYVDAFDNATLTKLSFCHCVKLIMETQHVSLDVVAQYLQQLGYDQQTITNIIHGIESVSLPTMSRDRLAAITVDLMTRGLPPYTYYGACD